MLPFSLLELTQTKRKFLTVSLLLVVWLSFFLVALRTLDPDFGWHITLGRLIIDSGIPRTDPFSYTMPSFPFVDHEWLTNIFLNELYAKIGYSGLAFIFSLLPFLVCFLVAHRNLKTYSYIPIFLALSVMLSRFGIRPQVIGWVYLGILLRVLLVKGVWEKYRYLIVAFFVLWVNTHGSFPLGLIVIFLFILTRFVKTRKIDLSDLMVVVLLPAVSLLNPYGIRIWGEVFNQVSDTNLHKTISEWNPFWHAVDFGYLVSLVLSFMFMSRYWSRYELWEKGLTLITFLMSLSAVRHTPIFMIFSIPIISKGFSYLRVEVGEKKAAIFRFDAFLLVLFLLTLLIFSMELTFGLVRSKVQTEDLSYPRSASEFLRQDEVKGNLFAPYNWGGYLIWKLPERKLFIDGRMPSFRWKAPPGESDSALKDYLDVTSGERVSELFNKYSVEHVLWFAPSTRTAGPIMKKIITILNQEDSEKDKFVEWLDNNDWEKVYKDDVAVVYKKRSKI